MLYFRYEGYNSSVSCLFYLLPAMSENVRRITSRHVSTNVMTDILLQDVLVIIISLCTRYTFPLEDYINIVNSQWSEFIKKAAGVAP